MSDLRGMLASEIRAALGQHNDDNRPVVELVRALSADYDRLNGSLSARVLGLAAELDKLTRELAEARDRLREAIIDAYSQGARDAHEHYEPQRDPDFTEAAHDYAADFLSRTEGASGNGSPTRYLTPAEERTMHKALRETVTVVREGKSATDGSATLAPRPCPDWKTAALIAGEFIGRTGLPGYYSMTPDEWLTWVRGELTAESESGRQR